MQFSDSFYRKRTIHPLTYPSLNSSIYTHPTRPRDKQQCEVLEGSKPSQPRVIVPEREKEAEANLRQYSS